MAKKGKKGGGGGKKQKDKNQDKKREKVIKDRTFGMKNKGGKKAKEAIRQMKHSQMSTKQQKMQDARRQAMKTQRKAAEAEKSELAALFKTAQKKQRIQGDPGKVICEFFKKGACKKGKKCKFSHDWTKVRKVEKLDIYQDRREEEQNDMKGWDQEKLEEVVKKKENKCQTDIICKYFLDALEKQLYGYFWICPNGGDTCMYKHALPPGYVLKTNKEKEQESENVDEGPSLEERLEQMRSDLASRTDLTKVTLETFEKWKADKKQQKAAERQEKAQAAKKKGKFDALSGRDLFEYDPTVFQDDDEADDEQYVIESGDEEEDETEFKEYSSSTNRPPKDGSEAEINNGDGVLVPPSAAEHAALSTSNGSSSQKTTKKSRQKNKNKKKSSEPEPSDKNPSTNGDSEIVVGDESLFLMEDLDDIDFSDDE